MIFSETGSICGIMPCLRTRGLFLEPGLALALGEHRLDLRQRDAARMQHHQQMVEQVGGLAGQMLVVLVDGGDHGLDRLLAELLGAMGDAAIDELARIGDVGARLGAFLDAFFEVLQCEVSHDGLPIAPLSADGGEDQHRALRRT